MKMMLMGCGAVGECIVHLLVQRDPKKEWFTQCVLADLDINRANEVKNHLKDDRFTTCQVDATNTKQMTQIMKENNIDFVMDATSPFCANFIFDAAFEAGCDYANMGTWSVPKKDPAYGYGIENSYDQVMTKYNFDQHEDWKEKGQTALLCLGIDPGVVNVFARYLCQYEFDTVEALHVKDGGNLHIPTNDPDDIVFGFNVWTVLDEVMNPNVEYIDGKFLVEKPFAGKEVYDMPIVGKNTLVKVEHEETVTMPRYLHQYGLKNCTFKIALDENLINALKVLDKLHLNSIDPIEIKGTKIIPRDVVAACAPDPKNIKDEMQGRMVVGVEAIGKKDGKDKRVIMYQTYSNEEAMKRFGLQAVVAQTGFGAALAIELYAKRVYKQPGVYSLEAFEPMPYLDLMKETGFDYMIKEVK